MEPTFTSYATPHGTLDSFTTEASLFSAWNNRRLQLMPGATHFGFVQTGEANLSCASGSFRLRSGMYFSVPDEMSIEGGDGIIMSRLDYRGFFQLGVSIEQSGRLRYIDGCTDSLLIPPVLRGDACLNLLELPAGTRQSQHTHPSIRLGLIIRGTGTCVTPEKNIPLSPGMAFSIRTNGLHSFHTAADSLLVVAYHPDSDFGPTDENHPMVNRTILSV